MSTIGVAERRRLLDAMLEELAEKGYPGTDVEAAARRAQLKSEEWTAWYPDKDACILSAFEQLAQQMVQRVANEAQGGANWVRKVAMGLRALLTQLSEQADIAEALMATMPSIGMKARLRYIAFLERLAPFLQEGRGYSEAGAQLPESVELLALGAAESIIFDQIKTGQTARIDRLTPEILFSVLVPFMGPDGASEAMEDERQLHALEGAA